MALRFTTTRLGGLKAAGRASELQHAVIAPFLARELGPRHARFFADFEPEGSDLRAWYIDAERPLRRVANLPPEERAPAAAAAGAIVSDVRSLADRLATGGAQQANLARILTAASTFPEEDLWWDGSQPVAVNWGYVREDRPENLPLAITALAPERLTKRAVAGPEAVAAARAGVLVRRAAPAGIAALLWLFFVLLVLATYRQLLPACGITAPWAGPAASQMLDACPAAAWSAASEAQEGRILEAQLRQAELAFAEKRQLCTAPGRRAELDRVPAAAPLRLASGDPPASVRTRP